ncbi:uncharacterized protein MYCFIDRAFT_179709 [Pseudocercospora fijiensis CIRAD86]|uniref:Uncharacterized protein n=1 Tax=Pseudocercospora fijiensis (strain CIRAD86) TaxID=383855 RepID=M3AJ35_PSEFD|nr:uncharacterized protein MYCFIDRAFT_179709 [Pseudocercospora fijiensis CIRAD86]EME77492.1 hypothetical protein MYCFIDRAFT_179709 [Pseudocercospora fijiensis CIRAD86]
MVLRAHGATYCIAQSASELRPRDRDADAGPTRRACINLCLHHHHHLPAGKCITMKQSFIRYAGRQSANTPAPPHLTAQANLPAFDGTFRLDNTKRTKKMFAAMAPKPCDGEVGDVRLHATANDGLWRPDDRDANSWPCELPCAPPFVQLCERLALRTSCELVTQTAVRRTCRCTITQLLQIHIHSLQLPYMELGADNFTAITRETFKITTTRTELIHVCHPPPMSSPLLLHCTAISLTMLAADTKLLSKHTMRCQRSEFVSELRARHPIQHRRPCSRFPLRGGRNSLLLFRLLLLSCFSSAYCPCLTPYKTWSQSTQLNPTKSKRSERWITRHELSTTAASLACLSKSIARRASQPVAGCRAHTTLVTLPSIDCSSSGLEGRGAPLRQHSSTKSRNRFVTLAGLFEQKQKEFDHHIESIVIPDLLAFENSNMPNGRSAATNQQPDTAPSAPPSLAMASLQSMAGANVQPFRPVPLTPVVPEWQAMGGGNYGMLANQAHGFRHYGSYGDASASYGGMEVPVQPDPLSSMPTRISTSSSNTALQAFPPAWHPTSTSGSSSSSTWNAQRFPSFMPELRAPSFVAPTNISGSGSVSHLTAQPVYPWLDTDLLASTPSGGPRVNGNLNVANHNIANHNIANHNIAHHNIANHDIAIHDVANQNIAIHDVANQNIANHNIANHNITNHEIANHDVANHDIAHQNVAHYNIAHYDIANHNPSACLPPQPVQPWLGTDLLASTSYGSPQVNGNINIVNDKSTLGMSTTSIDQGMFAPDPTPTEPMQTPGTKNIVTELTNDIWASVTHRHRRIPRQMVDVSNVDANSSGWFIEHFLERIGMESGGKKEKEPLYETRMESPVVFSSRNKSRDDRVLGLEDRMSIGVFYSQRECGRWRLAAGAFDSRISHSSTCLKASVRHLPRGDGTFALQYRKS